MNFELNNFPSGNADYDFLHDYVFLEEDLPFSEDDFIPWAPEICDIFGEDLNAGSNPIPAPETSEAAFSTQNEPLPRVVPPSVALKDILTGDMDLQDASSGIVRGSSNPNATSRNGGTEPGVRACWRCKILKKRVYL